jgi:hypothetical protein
MTQSVRVTEAEVMAVIEPQWSSSWHPVSHAKVVTALESAVEERGLAVVNKNYSLTQNGGRMFGSWQIDSGDPKYNYSLGFRNSIDQSMALGMVAGNHIMVCSNMQFSGDYITFRKHTGGLDLDELVYMANKAIEITMTKMGAFHAWHESLHEVPVSVNQGKILTFDFMKKGVIAPSQFKAYGEMVKEEYEESRECSLYTYHGGVTRLMRDKSLFQIADSSKRLAGVCNDFIKIAA